MNENNWSFMEMLRLEGLVLTMLLQRKDKEVPGVSQKVLRQIFFLGSAQDQSQKICGPPSYSVRPTGAKSISGRTCSKVC